MVLQRSVRRRWKTCLGYAAKGCLTNQFPIYANFFSRIFAFFDTPLPENAGVAAADRLAGTVLRTSLSTDRRAELGGVSVQKGAFGPLGVGQGIQKEEGMKGLAPSFTPRRGDARPCLQRAPPGITSHHALIADISAQKPTV